MRVAISNIAWETPDDEAVAKLLQQRGVDAIDIAPGKYFSDLHTASDAEIDAVRAWWGERGIEILGMQALLFGATGLNMFGDADTQARMLSHLGAVAHIAGRLGAPRLVFGSPKNRDRSGWDDVSAMAVAVPFFRRLGDIAATQGVIFCLEPNPACYGANFMTNAADTAAVVRAVAHPAIRMQFDVGALVIHGEAPEAVLADCADLIGHVHASEPQLVTLGDSGVDHASFGRALRGVLPAHAVTIEMVASRTEPTPAAIARALDVALAAYGDVDGGDS